MLRTFFLTITPDAAPHRSGPGGGGEARYTPARRPDENKKTAWPNSVQLAVLFLAQVNFHSFVQSIRENPDDIFLRHAGGHDFTFKIAKPAGQHNKPDKFRVSHETTLPKRKKRPVKRAQKGYCILYVICTSYARHLHVKNLLSGSFDVLLDGAP